MQHSSALASLVRTDSLTIGLELPLDNDWSPEGDMRRAGDGRPRGVPDLSRHLEFARRADRLGFAALWLRDVPVFDSARMGDAGSVFDVFTYLGFLAGVTRNIVLATGAIVLPLRHPIMIAKAAASVDILSGGRLVLGVASGDRPVEYPLFGVRFEQRGEAFREAVQYIRDVWGKGGISFGDRSREPSLDILPKPLRGSIPMVIAGQARQDDAWIASHMAGRLVYPGPLGLLAIQADAWRRIGPPDGAFLTPFHLDLAADPNEPPTPIRLGGRMGLRPFLDHLHQLVAVGVHHVAINLRQSRRPVLEVMEELAANALPMFEQTRSAA